MNEQARRLHSEIEALYPTLQDDGLSWSDFVEQLSYLLTLKWGFERTLIGSASAFVAGHDWPALKGKDGEPLASLYAKTLEAAALKKGLLNLVFRGAVNKVRAPAKLRQLVEFVDARVWSALPADVRGPVFEALLLREVAELQSPNFTPRPLIDAIIDVMRPKGGERVADPACATGGFLIGAHDYIARHEDLDADEKRALREELLVGTEISSVRARSGVINLLLHGIGSPDLLAKTVVESADSLLAEPSRKVDLVLTNPTFGRADDVPPARTDFWAATADKQLNFVQHVRSMLHVGGRTALFVPDSVLFIGGAGETIRRRLLKECDLHTLLRLPTGIFFRPGVKVNVLFFERRAASKSDATKELWVYDLRTSTHFTPKQKPLERNNLDDFVACFRADDRAARKETERFRRYTADEIAQRDGLSLDLPAYITDEAAFDPSALPAPSVLAREILEHLAAASDQFEAVANKLDPPEAQAP